MSDPANKTLDEIRSLRMDAEAMVNEIINALHERTGCDSIRISCATHYVDGERVGYLSDIRLEF